MFGSELITGRIQPKVELLKWIDNWVFSVGIVNKDLSYKFKGFFSN